MNAAVTYTGPADLVRLLEQGLFCQLFEREGMGRAGPRGTSLYQAQRSDAWVICVGSKLASGGREKTTRGVFTQRVRVRDEVTGYLGQEVILPCNFAATISDIKVSQVTWVKETAGRKQNVAVYHPDHGPSYPMEPVSRRIHFRTPSLEDATLIIDRLLMTDEGTYTCEFATYPLGNEDGVTNLIILAKPTNTAKSLEVKIGNNAVPVAVCTSAQGKPPARITWQPESSVNSSVSEVENADGTVTVTSQYIMVPTREANEQHITCLVEHKTLPQPQSIPVELSILYPPEVAIEGYDDNWYLSRSEAMLQCIAKGNPKPTEFTWTTSSGSLPKTVEIQDNKLLVRNVDASVNTTFICKVTNRVGQVSTEQVILVRDKPNSDGAGTTGGIIGGLIAAIVALAVVATGILICRQQQKNRMEQEEDDLEGPPAYKPPPPCQLSEETEPVPKPSEAETIPLKSPYFEPSDTDGHFGGVLPTTVEEAPRYHELPTLEEREAAADPAPSLDDEYLDQINPIYDALSFAAAEEEVALAPLATDKAFVMSRAMYV
ncbi:nectin-2 isoform X3 [Hemicordylus capensis]|uniref:nectin-2 isoform X3 n=1 Tax=Hemicordylus capensis TaxID=884348 RepID=UPI002302FF4D|nr:nectin-2 isoform X3 [Hemicordylus capensis]